MDRGLSLKYPEVSPVSMGGILRGGLFSWCLSDWLQAMEGGGKKKINEIRKNGPLTILDSR